MQRRTIIIAISGVLVLIIGLVVLNIVLRNRSIDSVTTGDTVDGGTLPESQNVFSSDLTPEAGTTGTDAGESGSLGLDNLQLDSPTTSGSASSTTLPRVLQLTDEAIVSAALTADRDRIQYFRMSDGTLHTVSFDGQNNEQKTFGEVAGLLDVDFSPAGDRALLQIDSETDPDGIGYQVLVPSTSQVTDLHPSVGEIRWDDTGQQLVYIFYNQGGNYFDLSVSQNDGSRFRSVKVLDSGDYTIGIIPRTSLAYYYEQSSGHIPATLNTVDVNTASQAVYSTDRYGFDVLWAPDGQRALFFEARSASSGDSRTLLFDRATRQVTELRLRTTVDKVVWGNDSQTIYVALPSYLGTLYPDDYREGFIDLKDTFWSINVSTGAAEQLTSGDEIPQSLNATKLFLSDDQRHIYFVNQVDRHLYSINF